MLNETTTNMQITHMREDKEDPYGTPKCPLPSAEERTHIMKRITTMKKLLWIRGSVLIRIKIMHTNINILLIYSQKLFRKQKFCGNEIWDRKKRGIFSGFSLNTGLSTFVYR